MFGTISYDAKAKEPRFVESEEPAANMQRYKRDRTPHVACEYCRTRKLKCSGQLTGCERCAALALKCVYPPTAEGRKSKRSSLGAGASASESPAKRWAVDGVIKPQDLDKRRHSSPVREARAEITARGSYRQDDIMSDFMAAYAERMSSSCDDFLRAGSAEYFTMRDLNDSPILDWELESTFMSPSAIFSVEAGAKSGPRAQSSNNSASSTLQETLDPLPAENPNRSLVIQAPQPGESCICKSIVNTGPASVYNTNFVATPSSISSSTTNGSTSVRVPTTESERSSTLSSGERDLQRDNQHQEQPRKSDTGEPAEMEVEKPCNCLRKTACLLEHLSTSVVDGVGIQEIDVLLCCSRQALRGCQAVACCNTCSTRSEIVTLLAMAAQYLSMVLSKMASACEEPGDTLPRICCKSNGNKEDGDDVNYDDGERCRKANQFDGQQQERIGNTHGTADMWFRSYKIDTAREVRQAVTGLVMVQLMDLRQLLNVLKVLSGTKVAALGTLSQVEGKVSEIRERLSACGSALWAKGINAEGREYFLQKV